MTKKLYISQLRYRLLNTLYVSSKRDDQHLPLNTPVFEPAYVSVRGSFAKTSLTSWKYGGGIVNENWCNHSELTSLQGIYFCAHEQAVVDDNDEDEEKKRTNGRFQRCLVCATRVWIFLREKREQMLNDNRQIQKELYKIIVLFIWHIHTYFISCLFIESVSL